MDATSRVPVESNIPAEGNIPVEHRSRYWQFLLLRG
jgi:hypothetical protein